MPSWQFGSGHKPHPFRQATPRLTSASAAFPAHFLTRSDFTRRCVIRPVDAFQQWSRASKRSTTKCAPFTGHFWTAKRRERPIVRRRKRCSVHAEEAPSVLAKAVLVWSSVKALKPALVSATPLRDTPSGQL